jgi:glutamine synthetase type III
MITLCQIKALQREFDLTYTEEFGYITLGSKHPAWELKSGQMALAQFSYMEYDKKYNLIFLAAVIYRGHDSFILLPACYAKDDSTATSANEAPPLSYEQLRIHLKSLLEDFDYLSLYKKQLKLQQNISNISHDFE